MPLYTVRLETSNNEALPGICFGDKTDLNGGQMPFEGSLQEAEELARRMNQYSAHFHYKIYQLVEI